MTLNGPLMNEATHGRRPGDQTLRKGAARGVGFMKDVKHVPLPDDVAEWMGMDQEAAQLAVSLNQTPSNEADTSPGSAPEPGSLPEQAEHAEETAEHAEHAADI